MTSGARSIPLLQAALAIGRIRCLAEPIGMFRAVGLFDPENAPRTGAGLARDRRIGVVGSVLWAILRRQRVSH